LPNQRKNRNIPPGLSDAAGGAVGSTGICVILICAVFVSGNWQTTEKFQASQNQAGKLINKLSVFIIQYL
jgi:hypothetical protein